MIQINTIEEFKDLKDYYFVDRVGNVYSHSPRKKGGIIAPYDNTGYLYVDLMLKNNKSRKIGIHRIVASAYIPNPNNYATVNHKNHIRHDNRVENLEWIPQERQYNDIWLQKQHDRYR